MSAARFLHSVLKEFACNAGDTPQPQTRYGSITARSVVPVPPDFDARYSARWKRYVYYVCAGNSDRLPFAWTRYAWQIHQPLDFAAMIDAAKMLAGEHDFEWMCVMQRGELRDPRREVRLCVETVPMKTDANTTPYFLEQSRATTIYEITCTCDFFLYKMVRRIVGILVAVGRGDADLDELRICLEAHDSGHELNGAEVRIPLNLLQTAPAKGLCLDHIEYDIAI